MPRSLQSATLCFGLVNIPVRLYTAAKSKAVSFHWLDPQGQRVKQRLYSTHFEEMPDTPFTQPARDSSEVLPPSGGIARPFSDSSGTPSPIGTEPGHTARGSRWIQREIPVPSPPANAPPLEQEMPREALLKGYEVSRNEYVTLSPEELNALEDATNQNAEIQEFVPLNSVDPVFFEKTYYLGPDKGGEKPYALLGRALRERKSGAIAKLVMRGKEKVVFIRPTGEGRLVLEVLYWGDEIRDFNEVQIPEAPLKDQEVSLAGKLIESLSNEQWEPHKYHDTYRERVLELIQKKQQGQKILPTQSRPAGEVLDLMEALKRSLQKGEGKKKAPAKVAQQAAPSQRRKRNVS
jgi:DNA end-binding protein Ku